jgi:sterol desaturase/sphingolipid hydroxylase (fatty acid hydroxylase superfamily)
MSPSPDTSHLLASQAVKRASLSQWEQLMARYPLGSRGMIAWQVLSTLAANGIIVWLIATARMTPFELVALVAIEVVLLVGIGWLQGRSVPVAAREKQAMAPRERLVTGAFALFWLGGVYSFVFLGFVPSGEEIGRALRDPIAFLAGSNLKWPLLITLAGAALDVMQDAAHFRRHGGTFISTPGFHGAARWLTLFLGGIPFFVPLVGIVVAIKLVADRVGPALTRRLGSPRLPVQMLLILMIPVSILLAILGLGWIADAVEGWTGPVAEVAWWAWCYGAAKFVAELFIVCLPLIAHKAHAEESAPPPAPGPRSRRR